MTTNSYINVAAIKAEYAPYHTFPEFEQGFTAYINGRRCPQLEGVAAQAADRGYEAGMKVARAQRWIEQNVGMN